MGRVHSRQSGQEAVGAVAEADRTQAELSAKAFSEPALCK